MPLPEKRGAGVFSGMASVIVTPILLIAAGVFHVLLRLKAKGKTGT
jgi:hypothetical protein